jgi:hypothetical protein
MSNGYQLDVNISVGSIKLLLGATNVFSYVLMGPSPKFISLGALCPIIASLVGEKRCLP